MKNTEILDVYTDYILGSFKLVTATGLSQLLEEGYSHDKISRFLAQGKFNQKEFWKRVKKLIRTVERDDACIAIDDTIYEKPHSTENDIVCYHWDHCIGRNVKGINAINFLYHTENEEGQRINLPLAYEIIEKTEHYTDPKTGKNKRRSPQTKNEIVRERLRVIVQKNSVKFRYALWDSWFTCKENMKFVHKTLKKYFVGALKRNRKVYLSEEARTKGILTVVTELDYQTNQAIKVWMKGLDFPVLLTKTIFINKDGSNGELYLVTNDTEMTGSDIFTTYKKRWEVEVFHKSLKQNAGIEKSPTKYEVTQCNHIFASMIAYCKLEILKVAKAINHHAIKSMLYIKAIKAALNELNELRGKAPDLMGLDLA